MVNENENHSQQQEGQEITFFHIYDYNTEEMYSTVRFVYNFNKYESLLCYYLHENVINKTSMFYNCANKNRNLINTQIRIAFKERK